MQCVYTYKNIHFDYLTFNNIELYNFEVRVEFKLKIKRKTAKIII